MGTVTFFIATINFMPGKGMGGGAYDLDLETGERSVARSFFNYTFVGSAKVGGEEKKEASTDTWVGM